MIEPRQARIDAGLLAPCDGVVDIPGRALSEAQAARLWARDRTALGDCRRRHRALAKSVSVVTGQR